MPHTAAKIERIADYYRTLDRLRAGAHTEQGKLEQALETLGRHAAKVEAGTRRRLAAGDDFHAAEWTDRRDRAQARIEKYRAQIAELEASPPAVA